MRLQANLAVMILISLTMFNACGDPPLEEPVLDAAQIEEVEAWRVQRDTSLRADDGWLTLVGLFWVEPGEQTVGSGAESSIQFPSGPESLGTLVVSEEEVHFSATAFVPVLVDGEPVTETELRPDTSDSPTVLEIGTLKIFLIERAGRLALRLKDSASPVLQGFTGLDYFPLSAKHRIVASFDTFSEPRSIPIPMFSAT